MNARPTFTIRPYKHAGLWVFDDPAVDLVQEPFLSGADQIIEHFVGDMPGALSGFTLVFSAKPFPGHHAELAWVRPEADGHWYRLEESGLEGWLAPTLLRYFSTPPARLYVGFASKPGWEGAR